MDNIEEKDAAIKLLSDMEENPVKYLEPNGRQADWIEMIGTHRDGVDCRTKTFSAANKFLGKTCGSMAILTNIVFGKQSEWFDYPLYKDWTFPKNCWIISTPAAINQVIVPEMLKWFPKGRFTTKNFGKNFSYEWKTDTGWTIWLRTFAEDPLDFESTLLGLVMISEPIPQQIYEAIPARMNEGGIVMVEMTPLEDSAWYFREVVEGGKTEIMYGDIEGGCQEHGIRGRHPHWQIEQFKDAIIDPDKYQARVHGKPISYGNIIFKTFNRKLNVVDTRSILPQEQVWFSIDPHWSKPPFCQWWVIDETNHLRCALEYPAYKDGAGYETIIDTRLKVEDFTRTILEIERQWGFKGKITRRIMDPFFGAKKYADREYTVKQKFAMHGLSCVFPPTNKIRRILIGETEIKERLALPVRLTWERHCLNSIRAMSNYSIVRPRNIDDNRDKVSERFPVTEKWKHAIDTTRYVVICNPTYEHYFESELDGSNRPWREQLLDGESSAWNPMGA